MKYYIYSNDPDLRFEEQVDSLEDLECTLGERFSDEIEDALGSKNPTREKRQGYFWNTDEIDAALYDYARSYLQQRFGGKIFGKVVDDDGGIFSNRPIDPWTQIIASRQDREQSYIDVGSTIIDMLANFLRDGVWQFGLRREDGTILTKSAQWPHAEKDERGLIWQDRSGSLEPVIWFGLQDERPIECWTLDRSPTQSKCLSVYDNPYAKEAHPVERWQNFWFCSFWTLDWNALFGNDGGPCIIWMFAECGMEEPVEGFCAVRAYCPIELNEQDTSEMLFRKIEEFFSEKQRGLG